MSNDPAPAPPSTVAAAAPARRFKRSKQLLLALGVAAVALTLARNIVVGPIVVAAANHILQAEDANARLTVGDWSGSWLFGLELSGVTLRAATPSIDVRDMRIRTLALSYRPLALLAGDLSALHIAIDDSKTALVLPPETKTAPAPSGDPWPQVIPALPTIAVTNAEVQLTTADNSSLACSDVAVSLNSAGVCQVDAPSLQVARADQLTIESTATLRATLRGDTVTIEQLALSPWLTTQQGSVQLHAQGVVTSIVAQVLGANTRLSIHATPAGAETTLVVGGFDLHALPSLPLAGVLPNMAGTVSVEAYAQIDFTSPLSSTGQIHLEAEQLKTPFWNAQTVTISAELIEGSLHADLCSSSPTHRVALTHVHMPLMLNQPLEALYALSGHVRVETTSVPQLIPESMRAAVVAPPMHSLQLIAQVMSGTARIASATLATAQGVVSMQGGVRAPLGEPDRWRESVIAAQVLVHADDLATLRNAVGLGPVLGGRAKASVTVTGTLAHPEGMARISASEVTVSGLDIGVVETTLVAHAATLTAQTLRVDGALGTLTASGAYDLASGEFLGVELAARLSHLDSLPPLTHGWAEINARLAGPWQSPRGNVHVEANNVAVGGLHSLHVAAHVKTSGDQLTSESLVVQTPTWSLSAAATTDPNPWTLPTRLHLTSLELEAGADQLHLAQPVAISVGTDKLVVTNLALTGSGGRLSLAGVLEPARQALHLEAEALRITAYLAPWAEQVGSIDSISTTTDIVVEGQQLRATSTGELQAWRLPPKELAPLSCAWAASLLDGQLHLRSLRVTDAQGTRLHARATMPLQPLASQPLPTGLVTVQASASVHGERLSALLPAPLHLRGRIQTALELGGEWDSLRGQAVVTAPLMHLLANNDVVVGPTDLSAHLRYNDGLHLERLRLESPQLEADASGHIDLPQQFVGLSGASLSAVVVEARATTHALSLDWIRKLPGVSAEVAGALDGSWTLSGTLGAPRLLGSLRLTGGSGRFSRDIPALEQVDAQLLIDDQTLILRKLHGALGTGHFDATGRIELDKGPHIDLRARGFDLLLVRNRDVRARANTDLTIQGPLAALTVTGTATITSARFTKRLELLELPTHRSAPIRSTDLQLFSLTSPPLANARFDVQITAQEPIVIDTNMAAGGLRPDLRLLGTGEVPYVTGTVYLDPTRVFLPAGTLTIESGTVQFLADNPFMPQIDLRGSTRLRGYDIITQASGPLEAVEMLVTSTPPLAQTDLIALLLTGQMPKSDGDSQGLRRGGEAVAFYLAKDILSKWFSGTDDGSESFLDRFTVITGRDATRSGGETIEATFRIATDVFGRNDTVFLTTEQDVYDHYGVGVRLVFRMP